MLTSVDFEVTGSTLVDLEQLARNKLKELSPASNWLVTMSLTPTATDQSGKVSLWTGTVRAEITND